MADPHHTICKIIDEEGVEALIGNQVLEFLGDPEAREYFTPIELWAMEQLAPVMELVKWEHQALRDQYAADKDVRYVLETMDIEGFFYAIVYKFDIAAHIGGGSTMAQLQHVLKACASVLTKMANDYHD